MPSYRGRLANAGPTGNLRSLTCWGWGGDSCQTEVAGGAGSRGGSEAGHPAEMARGAGQALRGHGEKHPGETEGKWGQCYQGALRVKWPCPGEGHAFWGCLSTAPLLGSPGFLLLTRGPGRGGRPLFSLPPFPPTPPQGRQLVIVLFILIPNLNSGCPGPQAPGSGS